MCVECGCETKDTKPEAPEDSGASASRRLVGLCSADSVRDGDLMAFDVGGVRIAVARVAGRHYAIADTCTHMRCSLAQGELEGTTVVCPCHMGTFDLITGRVLAGPPPAPVRTYPVLVDGGELQIEVDATRAA